MLQAIVRTIFHVRTRVDRGAALLDEHRPGWAKDVDVAHLEMADAYACVLGQVMGGYRGGREALGLWSNRAACRHGFIGSLAGRFLPSLARAEDRLLRDAWTTAIRERTEHAGRDRRLRVRVLLGSGSEAEQCRCQSAAMVVSSHNRLE